MDQPTSNSSEPSGDSAALRHLRRRYDLLRDEYEDLLDRLTTLEDRLERKPAGPAHSLGLVDAMQAPLVRLRDEYRVASREIQRMLDGIESVVSGQMKPQRGSDPGPRRVHLFDDQDVDGDLSPNHSAPSAIRVDVKGDGYRDLLLFQSHLESLPGVARVAISAMDSERATLIVELQPG